MEWELEATPCLGTPFDTKKYEISLSVRKAKFILPIGILCSDGTESKGCAATHSSSVKEYVTPISTVLL